MLAFLLGLIGFAAGHASVQHNNAMLPWLFLETEDGDGKRDTKDMALLYMLAQNGHHGSEYASHQMNSILPLLVLNKKSEHESKQSKLLLMMMMQDPTILNDPTRLTPYILYYKDMQDVDADEKDIDMISLFIISSMIQRDCSIDTNNGLTLLIPHLMMDGAGKDDMLKIMILMQIMGSGNNVVDMDFIMPFILLKDDDATEENKLMTMILLSSISGGLDMPNAFNANFNLLMPFALNNCDALTGTDLTKCVKNREKMIVLMIAMQSMAPGSPLTSEQLLPLILMKDGQSNEELIIFMTMMSQQKSCLPTEPIIIDKPAPPMEVIYRTFAIDPVTGKRTLISESNDATEYN